MMKDILNSPKNEDEFPYLKDKTKEILKLKSHLPIELQDSEV